VPEPDTERTVAGLIASRVRMTEGQLYTAVLAIIAAVLLTITGLPNAHRNASPAQVAPSVPSAQP
jgi:hypothetical protein